MPKKIKMVTAHVVEEDTPEFRSGPMEIWSSVGLAAIMIVLNIYSSWAASSLGATATFHMTHSISASWLGVCGTAISVMATILAWRGFGLNAIAGFLCSTSFAAALTNEFSFGLTSVTFIAISWLIAAIHYTRRFYEHNPFKTFVVLWGLTFASSISQSILFKVLFNPDYPLQGVFLLKLILLGMGGLILLLTIPRRNQEYVL